jgi:hypothetical protein
MRTFGGIVWFFQKLYSTEAIGLNLDSFQRVPATRLKISDVGFVCKQNGIEPIEFK